MCSQSKPMCVCTHVAQMYGHYLTVACRATLVGYGGLRRGETQHWLAERNALQDGERVLSVGLPSLMYRCIVQYLHYIKTLIINTLRQALKRMLCAINEIRQCIRIMLTFIKSYYITQIGYASVRLL